MVRIEDAGRIGFTAKECADSITLAADVIAMLANEPVKRSNLEVSIRHESVIREVVQRDQRGLR